MVARSRAQFSCVERDSAHCDELRGEHRGAARDAEEGREERVDTRVDEIAPAHARTLRWRSSTAARRGRFAAFALLVVAVATAAYIEDGRSVQESSRATDKPGAKPKPGFGRISAAELGKRFASSELGKHVGKFGSGLSELMLGGTKRLTQAVSQAAGASPFGIGVDPKAVKADHEAMLAWWCAQPGEASSSTCTRHAAVSKLRGEKDAAKRKAIFDR